MNKICSIFVDNMGPMDKKIITYLRDQYNSVFLVGKEMTTKYNDDTPYVYYNYIRHRSDIDIVFQNLSDIEVFRHISGKISYVYDVSRHNKNYSDISRLFSKVDCVLITDKNIPKNSLIHIFEYSKELLYV